MIQSGLQQELGLLQPLADVDFRWTRGRPCRVVSEPVEPAPGAFEPGTVPPKLARSNEEVDGVSWSLFTDGTLNVSRSTITWDRKAGNRLPEVLVCEGVGEEYNPLAQAPEAYLRFASIGRDPDHDAEVWLERRSAEAVAFVERYGLPRPGHYGAESRIGLPLTSFLNEAREMWVAVEYLIGASRAEHEADYSLLRQIIGRPERHTPDEDVYLLNTARRVMRRIWITHAHGIRLVPGLRRREELLELTPGYSCDSLFSAMWLQYYLAAVERHRLQPVCAGCGQPFEVGDKRQKYCNPYCRRAANERAYYRRNKEKGK